MVHANAGLMERVTRVPPWVGETLVMPALSGYAYAHKGMGPGTHHPVHAQRGKQGVAIDSDRRGWGRRSQKTLRMGFAMKVQRKAGSK